MKSEELNKITASYTTFLDRYYMTTIHKSLMKNVRVESLVLDFGGGNREIKKAYPAYNIINWDIIRDLRDIEDYRVLKPNFIICCHVLEHLSINEIKSVLNDFEKMGFEKLIIASPMENYLSKIASLTSKKDVHLGHKTKYKEINKLCEDKFVLIKRYTLFGMTEVSVYMKERSPYYCKFYNKENLFCNFKKHQIINSYSIECHCQNCNRFKFKERK